MTVHYIWDAYCGWCFGFKEILKPFLANHPELDVNIVSGGLFDQGNPISAYPHIPGANRQIATLFKVEFGQVYNDLMEEGNFVMNSYHAAAGYSVLKAYLPREQWLSAAEYLQCAFYQVGQSLSDPETYRQIAEKLAINSQDFNNDIAKALEIMAGQHPDYQIAQSFGVRSYPTLILEKGGKYYDLRSGAMTADELEKNFDFILRQ